MRMERREGRRGKWNLSREAEDASGRDETRPDSLGEASVPGLREASFQFGSPTREGFCLALRRAINARETA